jgi:cytidine deaminase
MDWDRLVAAASGARSNAHAPYSRFAVGAAVESSDGRVFAGANVENRSYGLALCAERAAVAAAVSAGARELAAVAVVTDVEPPAVPCGLCRETLAEFCGPELPILLASVAGGRRVVRLGELVPEPFRLPGS